MNRYFVFLFLIVANVLQADQVVRLVRAVKIARELQGIKCTNCDSKENLMQLSCGDTFCKECLADQVKTALKNQDIEGLHCMKHLAVLFSQVELAELAAFDSEINVAAVLNLINLSNMAKDPGFRRCPTPNCSATFMYKVRPGQKPLSRQCPQCNQVYCSDCLQKHDANQACQLDEDDSELYDIARCPKCNRQISKGPGCMQVTCGSPGRAFGEHNPLLGCGHTFCFGCYFPLKKEEGPYTKSHPWYCYQTTDANYHLMRPEAKLVRMKERMYTDAEKRAFDQALAEWKAKKAKERQNKPKAQPKR